MSATNSKPIGVLVVNLGTPDDTSVPAVRRFLKEFLSDPAVIDLPSPLRWLLLRAVILPFRPRKSAEAYRAIWESGGSPLMLRTLEFARALQEQLGDGFDVEVGMRYGTPSLSAGLAALKSRGAPSIVALPLYAQATASSTGTTEKELDRIMKGLACPPTLSVVPAFHDDEGYLSAMCEAVRPSLAGADHLLFCFHGVPERHVLQEDKPAGACLQSKDCCATFTASNCHCYRAQCHQTARRLAEALGLTIPWEVAFQSRLGRTPWLSPYADLLIDELALKGVKRLVVVPASFLCDCLENLEELGLRARESFLSKGGEDFRLVPALNASRDWVQAAAALVQQHGREAEPTSHSHSH